MPSISRSIAAAFIAMVLAAATGNLSAHAAPPDAATEDSATDHMEIPCDVQAQLGYLRGPCAEKSREQSVYWFKKAAEQGHPRAQYLLGMAFANGAGVPKDDAEAVTWFRRAAGQELSEAQVVLGLMYQEGRGVERDGEQALVWLTRAAMHGNADGQFFLGDAYYGGRGTEKDFARAYGWFRQAADQGHVNAQIALGMMSRWGDGVQKDPTQALAWWEKAAERADAKQAAILAGLRQSLAAEVDANAKQACRGPGEKPAAGDGSLTICSATSPAKP